MTGPPVLFNSVTFLAFFAAVFAVYLVLTHRAQNAWLLAASYLFYGWWDWRFLGLIVLSTAVDYTCGRRIAAADPDDPAGRAARRGWLLLSCATNLGLLGFFKYWNFFAESAAAALRGAGLEADWATLNVVLPVGISFYTFQTLGYTVDVYRGAVRAERDVLNFALFVSFFPQLVAGPIERANVLLPQIARPRRLTAERFARGGWLILKGFYLKVVLADNLGEFVAPAFGEPQSVRGLAVVSAVLGAGLQIYGDFAGYSAIARGVAKWLGVDLMQNFARPYFAVNPSDFWRRWHISLSTWLRDYLYIPLGGNRGGAWRTYRNLSLTMLLGGLWHGAAWNFVAWGAYHGALLCGYRLLSGRAPRFLSGRPAGRFPLARRLAGAALFLPFTLFGWVLFFSPTLAGVPDLLGNLRPFELSARMGVVTAAVFYLPVFVLELFEERADDEFAVFAWPPAARLAAAAALWAGILLSGRIGSGDFIYFQF